MSDDDLHYLRSILGQLRELRSLIEYDGLTLGGEVLADNIDWLDCFIDKYERGLELRIDREQREEIQRLNAHINKLDAENDRLQEWNHLRAMDIVALGQKVGKLEAEIERLQDKYDRLGDVVYAKNAELNRLRESCKTIALDKDVIIERLRAALSWIETYDPELVAKAREKFGALGGKEE